MATLTIADLDNGKRDLETVDAVANSQADTTTTRYGQQTLTLAGALRRLGWRAPVPYAPGLSVDSPTMTVEHYGIVYAPREVPFTAGVWDASQWYVLQDSALRSQLGAPTGSTHVGHLTPQGSPTTVGAELQSLRTGLTAAENAATIVPDLVSRTGCDVQPSFIEQFTSGMFRRGMLTKEVINVVTETTVAAASAGSPSVVLGSAANLAKGGGLVIKYANGSYRPHVITGLIGNTAFIFPKLEFPTDSTSRAERLWFNRAHPGKFYIRYLAERVAKSSEFEAAYPTERVFLCDFENTGVYAPDNVMVATGGATINYYPSSNFGDDGTVSSPVRFGPYRAAYVDGNALAQGMETPEFYVGQNQNLTVEINTWVSGPSTWALAVIDETGAILDVRTYTSENYSRITRLRVRTGSGLRVKIRAEVIDFKGSSALAFNSIDAYKTPEGGKLIPKPDAKVVCIGDSWVSGDTASTPEREPLTSHLRELMPFATIINSGVAGNTIFGLLPRFTTDVAAHKPDAVVVNVGTNDIYNPASGVVYPNATDLFFNSLRQLVSKIRGIGAKPIIIGVPALAQSDAETPHPEWTLQDRSRVYRREELRAFSPRKARFAGSSYRALPDGTLEMTTVLTILVPTASTPANVTWTFPRSFVIAPDVSTSLHGFESTSMQMVSASFATTSSVLVSAVSASAGVTVKVNVTAKGRWKP